jgi:tRNA1(Val) A37 N6-methylase TrmN6
VASLAFCAVTATGSKKQVDKSALNNAVFFISKNVSILKKIVGAKIYKMHIIITNPPYNAAIYQSNVGIVLF